MLLVHPEDVCAGVLDCGKRLPYPSRTTPPLFSYIFFFLLMIFSLKTRCLQETRIFLSKQACVYFVCYVADIGSNIHGGTQHMG